MSTTPSGLKIEDLTVGTGTTAQAGHDVTVHYTGWLHDPQAANGRGRSFDCSKSRGDPFEFSLGAGMVIQGWDDGVAGMKVGGRRRLTIPPHMGYGDRGAGGVIKGGETLVFVVDLLNVN